MTLEERIAYVKDAATRKPPKAVLHAFFSSPETDKRQEFLCNVDPNTTTSWSYGEAWRSVMMTNIDYCCSDCLAVWVSLTDDERTTLGV